MEVNFSISKALNKKPSGAADYLTFAKIKWQRNICYKFKKSKRTEEIAVV
jgi:hypothetical protein